MKYLFFVQTSDWNQFFLNLYIAITILINFGDSDDEGAMNMEEILLGKFFFHLANTQQSGEFLSGPWQLQQPIFDGEVIQRKDWYYNGSSTQSFQLPKQFNVEVRAWYNSPQAYALGDIALRAAVDIGLQKEWDEGKHQLALNRSDIFNTANAWDIRSNRPELNLQTTWNYTYESSAIRLSYRHNSGRKSVKSAWQRQTGSEEERRRVD